MVKTKEWAGVRPRSADFTWVAKGRHRGLYRRCDMVRFALKLYLNQAPVTYP